jgi:hypothetical protein
VTPLEQRLQALGPELGFPPEPDLAPAVLARLDRRPFPWNRAVLALAVLVVALGAALAVPQARSALQRWFHLVGVTVERVDTLPQAEERSKAQGLGSPLTREQAEERLGFELALPDKAPKTVYVLDRSLGTVVLEAHGRPVLLSEFQPVAFSLLKKAAGSKTTVEPARVNGRDGLWLEGGPHTLTYFDRLGQFQERTVLIRGNVLIWTRPNLTLRIEGRLTKAQALELAREIPN